MEKSLSHHTGNPQRTDERQKGKKSAVIGGRISNKLRAKEREGGT